MGYWNDISIIQNERDCFKSRAEADADLLNQGRFRKETATTVVGSGAPIYPTLPSGPWSAGDPGAPEPHTDQIDVDISAVGPIERPTPAAPALITTTTATFRCPSARSFVS